MKPVVRAFPTVEESNEYYEFFDRTLRPYTALHIAEPQMGRSDYLNKSNINDFEYHALRFFVDDYMRLHIANRYKSSRYLIYRPSRAGIGDRTGVLLYTYWLAVMSKRIFLVDWSSPFPLQHLLTNARPDANLFYDAKRDAPRGIIADPATKSLKVAFLNSTGMNYAWDEHILMSNVLTVVAHSNRMQRSFSDAFANFSKPENLSTPEMISFRANLNLQRAILHHVFRLSDDLIRDHIQMSHRMNLRSPYSAEEISRVGNLSGISTISGTKFVGKSNTQLIPYIGVHARIGKGVGEGMGRFSEITLHMKKAAKCLASRAVSLSHMTGEPPLPVFLATDTSEFRKLFQNVVSEMSHGRIKVLTGDWDIIHSTRMVPVSLGDTQSQDEELRKVMWGSYMDLIMLGHAQHVLALYSSFPRLGIRLGDAETLTELRNDICLKNDKWI